MKKFRLKQLLAILLVVAMVSVNELTFAATASALPAEQSQATQEESADSEQAPAKNSKTENSEEDPPPNKENPDTSKEKPDVSKEKPDTSKENPDTPKEDASASKEDSSAKKDTPSEKKENSEGKKEDSSAITQNQEVKNSEEDLLRDEGDTGEPSVTYTGTYTITINYIYRDNKKMAARPYIESVPAGEALSKSVKSPDVMGYQPLIADQEINTAAMDQDMTYDVYYVPKTNTPYTINHYQENIDRDGYTLTGVGHLSGTTNATVTASPQPYTGFTPPDVMPSATIHPDGSTTLDVYYTRNQYTMYFETGEGGSYIEPVTAAFDQPLVPPSDPIRPGYKFAGWGSHGFPSRMPIGDIMMTAEWEVEGMVSYTLVYWLESIEGNGTYDYVGAVQEQAPADSSPEILQNAPSSIGFPIDREHIEFNETKTAAEKPDKVNGTGSTIVNVYYDRKAYSISFGFDDTRYTLKKGDTVYETSPYVLTAKFGANIADQWPVDPPKLRPGKSGEGAFTGWAEKNKLSFSSLQHYLDQNLVNNQNLEAKWSYQTKNVNVTYLFEDLTGQGETPNYEQLINLDRMTIQWNAKSFIGFTPINNSVYITDNNSAVFHYKRNIYQITFYSSGTIDKNISGIKYETPISDLEYTPPTPAALPGYTFGGWYTSPQTFDGSEYDFSGKTMPAKNLILHAKWVKPTYTVTFHPNNGSADFTQRVLLQKNASEPEHPTRPGYRFEGWYKTGSSFRYVFPPVTGDTTLNARWIPIENVGYDVIYKIGTPENSMEHSRASYTGKTVGTKVTASAIAIPGLLPDAANKTLTLTAGENLIIFYYAPFSNMTYTVKYLENGTKAQLLPDKQVTTMASEITENYVHIAGYYPDRYQQILQLSPNQKENVLIFTYTKNSDASYKVEHYLEQTDGTYHHTSSHTDILTAPVGSVQSAEPKTFENYHYNAKISHHRDVVLPNNETILRLYYSLTRYTVKYIADQHGSLQGEDTFHDIRHGAPYKTGAPTPVPKPAAGYRFTGWEPSLPAPTTPVTANAVYTAKFALDPTQWSTVSYHPNGGTGTMEDNTVLTGSGYKIRPNSYTRANHQFVGWNTSPDADGTGYAEDDRITVTGDITLYAEWVPDTQYAVTYIANGGTGHMSDPHGFYYRDDPVHVLPNSYTRAGYRFTKWATHADGSGNSYNPADTFRIRENTALYAQWEKDPAQWVTIRFDKNHPQAAGFMESSEVLAEEPFAIPANRFELDHHDFRGWSSQRDGRGKSFDEEDEFTPIDKFPSQRTITLYAKWKEHKTYTVTYHSNNPSDQTVKDNASYYEGSKVVLRPSNTFDYPHHTFMYWTRSLFGDDAYMAGESFTIDRNMDFYAHWEKDPEFHVEYKDTYSQKSWNDPKTYRINPTGSDPVTVKNSMFQRDGYDFAGWDVEFKNAPGVRHASQPGNVLKDVTSDTTLYAQWNPHIYQITYDLQGGQVHGTNPSEYDIETPTFSLINPERPGYTFLGWSGTDIDNTKPSDSVTIQKGSTGDRQYQAHWEELPTDPPTESEEDPKPKPPAKSLPKAPANPKDKTPPAPATPAGPVRKTQAKPTRKSTPGTPAKKEIPKTGDNTPITFWIALAVTSSVLILGLSLRRKKGSPDTIPSKESEDPHE
ncbi:InlB B-repeat-containing protein [Blautia liquoris]|uniref:InlB B-repeat-containing protein n=1 Tax=Blautia liquoris TaxID=2779518 RepID=A0A7M2RD97_9FIRM|nr:InlB B-repeat-containing protein [Blautia liquoris]QOV18118.1 InlB B-repeat-containing protein [Blautia liquoris]